MAQKKNKLPFIIKIIGAYNQYRSFGYPVPLRVYVVNCSSESLKIIEEDIKNSNYSNHKHNLKEKNC